MQNCAGNNSAGNALTVCVIVLTINAIMQRVCAVKIKAIALMLMACASIMLIPRWAKVSNIPEAAAEDY